MAGQFHDSDTEEVFSDEQPKTPKTPTGNPPPAAHDFATTAEAREAALQRELEGVRNINELLEGVLGTLERAKGNMHVVGNTVNTASTLLNSWTRILSQTEHNQRLILNPGWKGATQDLLDIENEAAQKQMLAERRAREEEQRRAEAANRREEEQRRAEAASRTGTRVRGTRSRTTRSGVTRGTTRGGTSSYRTDFGTSSTAGTRGSSGIGRGYGSTRGRARGTRGGV